MPEVILITQPQKYTCPYCLVTFEAGVWHEILKCLGDQVIILKREIEILNSDIEMLMKEKRE